MVCLKFAYSLSVVIDFGWVWLIWVAWFGVRFLILWVLLDSFLILGLRLGLTWGGWLCNLGAFCGFLGFCALCVGLL